MRRDFLISDIKTVKLQELQECRVWFLGSSNWLLNYYTGEWFGGFQEEIFFNRDRMNYFWSLSATENNIKRVHSGLPRAMTDMLCYAVGNVAIKSGDGETKRKLDEIIGANNFHALMQQQVRPLTLALGWGAFKLSIDKKLSKHPIIEFYEADKVKFFAKKGIITAVEFMDEYTRDNKTYLLVERREAIDGNSVISYKLYETYENDKTKCHEVPLDTLEETKHLSTQVIKNLNRMLAVPVKFFYDIDNKIYGRSIFKGKIDIFDDLDQAISQRSRTCQLSTPVEYIDEMTLERDPKTQMPITPNRYDRQYVISHGLPNGDGSSSKQQIIATQPDLKLEQYDNLIFSLINLAISGVISLSTLGYNVSKKDNADAQREKEKTTIMTRNAIIDSEDKCIRETMELALVLQEIIDNGSYTEKHFDISITYGEFANPSFETKAATLTQMWGHNAISSEMFVKLLYGDSLSDEAKAKEIAELEKMRYEEYRETPSEDEIVADRLERNLYRDNVESETRRADT